VSRRPAVVARGLPAFAGAAGGGVLYFLGYLGWGVWPCLLVFLVPLWWALDDAIGLGRAALLGLVFGLAAYAGGFLWLWRLVDPFLDGNRVAGAILWLAYGAWFAAGFALYAILFVVLRRRGRPLALAGIVPLVAIEWLQPQLFPVNAGSALVAVPATAQAADLGGPLLLTALVAGADVAAFETWAWWRGRRAMPRSTWIATIAIALVLAVYGRVRTRAVETAAATAPAMRVGIVQANLGVMEKRMQGVVAHRRHLDQTRELLAGGAVDLVVWPETAYVRGLRRPLPISGQPIREDVSVPILFGASSVWEEGGRLVTANSALLVDADGTIRDAYDKNLLIPLTEYVPLAAYLPIGRWFPHVQVFGAAADTPALRLGPWRIATPICYEAIRADFVRRMVAASRPNLLVTLANDAWFGDSAEPWMHLALARLRAVEHRRYLVRATNSGISAIVDPAGRVLAQSGLLARENLRGTVHLLDQPTLYGRVGDWPGWVAALLVGAALVLRRRPLAAVTPGGPRGALRTSGDDN
jgi:apolipoprotein N-acyltransferase